MEGEYEEEGRPIPTQSGAPAFVANPSVNFIHPGLALLSRLDTLFVRQKIDAVEIICGCEMNNKYEVMDMYGRLLYSVREDTGCCTRLCCGPSRPFDIQIRMLGFGGEGEEVIHLARSFACTCGCCCCCRQELRVYSPPGVLVGTVEQQCTVCTPKFHVKDAEGNVVLQIKAQCCRCCMFGDVDYPLYSSDGQTIIGKISKKWAGIIQEGLSDADNFGVSFPMDLDVRMKAVVLGACVLIDFMYFEDKKGGKHAGGVGVGLGSNLLRQALTS